MKKVATIVSIAAAVCWLLFVLLRLFLGEDVFLAYRLEGWLLVVFIVDVMVTHTAPFDSHFEYKVCSNDPNYVARGKSDDSFEMVYLYHRDGVLERPVCWLDRYYNAYIEDLVVYENDDLVLFQYHHSECTSRTDTFHLDGSLYSDKRDE